MDTFQHNAHSLDTGAATGCQGNQGDTHTMKLTQAQVIAIIRRAELAQYRNGK